MSDDRTHDPAQPRTGSEAQSGEATSRSETSATGAGEHRGREHGWGRRELFKAMASVPVLGTLAYGVYRKTSSADEKRRKIRFLPRWV